MSPWPESFGEVSFVNILRKEFSLSGYRHRRCSGFFLSLLVLLQGLFFEGFLFKMLVTEFSRAAFFFRGGFSAGLSDRSSFFFT